jgi:p70 ribosomal S6 kinase
MESKGMLTEQEAADTMYKIIEALTHIHSCGIAHRDLKPENIMIDKDGHPKVIDFGLSRDTRDS